MCVTDKAGLILLSANYPLQKDLVISDILWHPNNSRLSLLSAIPDQYTLKFEYRTIIAVINEDPLYRTIDWSNSY